jgi:ribosome-binding protein aMBF1 (putative translation factor)
LFGRRQLEQLLSSPDLPSLHRTNVSPSPTVGNVGGMASESVPVELTNDIAEVVRHEAERIGKSEAEVVELAVRQFVKPSIIDRLWERSTMSEDEAMAIAVEEVRAVRNTRRAG